jgi:dihydroxyacetone kinase-like predicted kinase
LSEIFKGLGVDYVIEGGQTMNPSTEDILKAVESVNAPTVFVFPNNKNIIMAAQQCQPLTDKKVIVIPTRTIPQGIVSFLSFDESLEEAELEEQLNGAFSGVHTVNVTYAARDSVFDEVEIKAGEYLALLEGSLIANSADFGQVVKSIDDALAPFDPDMITVYRGCDASGENAVALSAGLQETFPDAEVTELAGGQPVYSFIISAE